MTLSSHSVHFCLISSNIIYFLTKGRLISKWVFGVFNSSRMERKQVNLRNHGTVGWFFWFIFLEELRILTSPFEINWPLKGNSVLFTQDSKIVFQIFSSYFLLIFLWNTSDCKQLGGVKFNFGCFMTFEFTYQAKKLENFAFYFWVLQKLLMLSLNSKNGFHLPYARQYNPLLNTNHT